MTSVYSFVCLFVFLFFQQKQSTINRYTRMAKDTTDAKSDHIPADDRRRVISDCEAADQWLFDQLQAQSRLHKADPPAVTCDQLKSRASALEIAAKAIMGKPKPVASSHDAKQKQAEKEKESFNNVEQE